MRNIRITFWVNISTQICWLCLRGWCLFSSGKYPISIPKILFKNRTFIYLFHSMSYYCVVEVCVSFFGYIKKNMMRIKSDFFRFSGKKQLCWNQRGPLTLPYKGEPGEWRNRTLEMSHTRDSIIYSISWQWVSMHRHWFNPKIRRCVNLNAIFHFTIFANCCAIIIDPIRHLNLNYVSIWMRFVCEKAWLICWKQTSAILHFMRSVLSLAKIWFDWFVLFFFK